LQTLQLGAHVVGSLDFIHRYLRADHCKLGEIRVSAIVLQSVSVSLSENAKDVCDENFAAVTKVGDLRSGSGSDGFALETNSTPVHSPETTWLEYSCCTLAHYLFCSKNCASYEKKLAVNAAVYHLKASFGFFRRGYDHRLKLEGTTMIYAGGQLYINRVRVKSWP
jgi:hypothetical protein